MIIKPKTRGFICTTAHPLGCEKQVDRQIDYAKSLTGYVPVKNALIIGASTGYGLASRIALAFGAKATTVGVIYDKDPTSTKPASAGFYNTCAFEKRALKEGLSAYTINGDAYSEEVKTRVIRKLKELNIKLDMVVYSLASPRRTLKTGETVASVLKTIGKPYTNKTIDLKTKEIKDITIDVATPKEVYSTIKVMGGEDYFDWIETLNEHNLLADDTKSIAYSYIGPSLTHPIYKDGTIGKAKDDLYNTTLKINKNIKNVNSFISVNKALVTQSSAAIPIVPLYISILYKIMKQNKTHEGCIEQMCRLFTDKISSMDLDKDGMFRLDDYELTKEIQEQVLKIFNKITTQNLNSYADIDGYDKDFMQLFGFMVDDINYENDVDPISSIKNLF